MTRPDGILGTHKVERFLVRHFRDVTIADEQSIEDGGVEKLPSPIPSPRSSATYGGLAAAVKRLQILARPAYALLLLHSDTEPRGVDAFEPLEASIEERTDDRPVRDLLTTHDVDATDLAK